MSDLIKGKKAVKDLCTAIGKTQREIAEMYNTNDSIISNRIKRGFYDKPGNYARLVYDLGLSLKIDIKAVILDQDGKKIMDVAIDTDYLEEE